MSGNIWKYDCYDIRKFKPGEITTFLDIGANKGEVTLLAKALNPTAKVISLEPCKETFEKLQINMKQWLRMGIKCYNVAFGDGSLLYLKKGSFSGVNRFHTAEEITELRIKETESTESKTLRQIFDDYKIEEDKPYIIKMDCEGSEKFMLQEKFLKESLNIIRNSVQTMMEVHLNKDFEATRDQWNCFFNDLRKTHELRSAKWVDKKTTDRRYVYTPCKEIRQEKGDIPIELVNRKWIGPWPGKGK